MVSVLKSFGQVFRIVFVLFSLYLLGDAFYRWDGFKFYASFSEYLPSFGLAFVLWTIVAVTVSILIWAPFRVLEWLFKRIAVKIEMEHLILYTVVLMLLGSAVWKVKIIQWPDVQTTSQLKVIVGICVALVSVFPVWLLGEKAGPWIKNLQERIIPLVWLFGIALVFFIPLVTYYTCFKETGGKLSHMVVPSTADVRAKPNILFVTFDALSARNMSLYGYSRPTTPFIDKWAQQATVFTRLEAETNFTAPTTASMMTGKRVWTHMRYHRMRGSRTIRSKKESMPAILKKNGYYNLAFISNDIASVKNLGMSDSFDVAPLATELWAYDLFATLYPKLIFPLFGEKFRIYNWLGQEDFILGKLFRRLSENLSHTTRNPEIAFNKFLSHVDNDIKEPFFAWIHVDPPHFPYLPHEPFMGKFDASQQMRTLKSQREQKTIIMEYQARHKAFPREVETLRARYDEFINYSDKQFENFIEEIGRRDISRNTIIILSTDHGEIFEHNSLLHGSTLYEPETNIPLIIMEPEKADGNTIHDIVEQIDIPATILDMAGIEVPEWMEGLSLLPLMRHGKSTSRTAISMNLERNSGHGTAISRGIIVAWEGDFKLIHNLENDESLLFNLRQDPNEMNDIFDEDHEAGKYLLGRINEELSKANARILHGE